MSTSFGGGVALSKNICGCLTAAAMAVGLEFGTTEPTGTAPRPAYARTKAVLDRFQERFGTTQCSELTSTWADDFAHPDRARKCGDLVLFTMQQVTEISSQGEESANWQESWWDDYLNRRDKIK